MSSRSHFLAQLAVMGTAACLPLPLFAARQEAILKPPRLQPGQTVGLINPASVIKDEQSIIDSETALAELGLKSIRGRFVLERHGYFSGTDEQRAEDVNRMFADPAIDAIIAIRGGWGCNRILPLLDYDLIRRNPKILMGYSDITSLLLAIYARTGLVTFHGPVGTSTWNEFTLDYVRRILFEGQAVTMTSPSPPLTLSSGTAQGRLAGGNLSVLAALLGSNYLPDWSGHILFLEDVEEDVYRVDRMLTHLKLAGVLDQVAGVVFGQCTRCDEGDSEYRFSLEQVLQQHLAQPGIPACYGAMIGHIEDKFTVPLGIRAELDADAGTVTLLEPAVR